MTSVDGEFEIARIIVSRASRVVQTAKTAIQGFGSGPPRATTEADDWNLVVQTRRYIRQTAREMEKHMLWTTGRQILRLTVNKKLHKCGLFARQSQCVSLASFLRRCRYLWCKEHKTWTEEQWSRLHFTDERRFRLDILNICTYGESAEQKYVLQF